MENQSERLKNLMSLYGAAVERFGKYVKVTERGGGLAVEFVVKNQSFFIQRDLENNEEGRELAEFFRIMFCEALNVMYLLESEGIDTSDIPEQRMLGAMVGKFFRAKFWHRPNDLVQVKEPKT